MKKGIEDCNTYSYERVWRFANGFIKKGDTFTVKSCNTYDEDITGKRFRLNEIYDFQSFAGANKFGLIGEHGEDVIYGINEIRSIILDNGSELNYYDGRNNETDFLLKNDEVFSDAIVGEFVSIVYRNSLWQENLKKCYVSDISRKSITIEVDRPEGYEKVKRRIKLKNILTVALLNKNKQVIVG